jgi:rod shape-determining protein MreD
VSADPRFRVPVLLVVALVVQTAVLVRLRIVGVMPDLLLLVAVAGGIVGGRARGASLGFGAGIGLDIFLESPFGLSALVYALVGYAVGVAQAGVLRWSWYVPAATALIASAGGTLLHVSLNAVLGQRVVAGSVPVTVIVVAAVNAVLAPAAVAAVRWALPDAPAPVGAP